MKDYYIAFHRPDLPGNQLVACKVSIGDYLIDRGDDDKQFDLALCEHPLYPMLVEYVRTNPPLPKLSPGEVRSALLRGVAQYYETQPWEPSLAETRLAEKVGIRFQRRYKDGGADRPDEVYWMAWYGSNPGVGVCVGCWDDVVKFAQSQGLSL